MTVEQTREEWLADFKAAEIAALAETGDDERPFPVRWTEAVNALPSEDDRNRLFYLADFQHAASGFYFGVGGEMLLYGLFRDMATRTGKPIRVVRETYRDIADRTGLLLMALSEHETDLYCLNIPGDE